MEQPSTYVTASGLQQSQPNLPSINRNTAKKHVKSHGFLKKSSGAAMQPNTVITTSSSMMHNNNVNNVV